jgi:dTDP-4-amino-4,6-dideoxygalactose transaminase
VSGLALFGGVPIRTRPFPSWPVHDEAEERRLLRTLRSGNWGRLQGEEVDEFERRFAAAHGCRHGIAVANGTVSLRLALIAAGIGADDEVIVPAYTFVSTATAVIEANAVPVFADIDRDTFNIDPQSVAAAIAPRTRAIIAVHFAGQPADMAALAGMARERNLVLIEDAAHAHGAISGTRPAGSLGRIASFSFQSSKNMTSGEGGIILTNDDDLAAACRSMQNCGRVPGGVWYEHHVISGNYRLGEFQGAILNCQLDRLEEQARRRDANGRALAERLRAVPGIHPQARPADCTRHSYHLFMLRLDPARFGAARGAVLDALRAEGIPCSAGYGYPLPQQPIFQRKAFGPYLPTSRARLDYTQVHCSVSDVICREQGVWLEQSLMLGSEQDIDDIARAFEKVYEHRSEVAAAASGARHA